MIGTSVRRAIGAGRVIACAVILLGCAQALSNDPVNQPLTANNPRQIEAGLRPDVETNYNDTRCRFRAVGCARQHSLMAC